LCWLFFSLFVVLIFVFVLILSQVENDDI